MSFAIEQDALDLLRVRNELDASIERLRYQKKSIDEKLIALLSSAHGDYVSFRYGENVVRVKPAYKMTLREESRKEVMTFLQEHAELDQLARFDALRIGQVKEVAGNHYRSVDTETGEVRQGWYAMKSDHFDESEGEHEVSVMPLERAPQFLQRLPEGEGMAK